MIWFDLMWCDEVGYCAYVADSNWADAFSRVDVDVAALLRSIAHDAFNLSYNTQQEAHRLWSSADSAAIQAFSMMTYKPSKLGQTDLVFGLWSEFITRSVHAGLHV